MLKVLDGRRLSISSAAAMAKGDLGISQRMPGCPRDSPHSHLISPPVQRCDIGFSKPRFFVVRNMVHYNERLIVHCQISQPESSPIHRSKTTRVPADELPDSYWFIVITTSDIRFPLVFQDLPHTFPIVHLQIHICSSLITYFTTALSFPPDFSPTLR